ncbi:hypothetical protein ACIQY5_19090 [Peribacillus frigoritolerans]|uniref:hypothetical protein n=1 Tax=Peribacillus frigoritolerans TaxID=450367 RepID=UPI00380F9599
MYACLQICTHGYIYGVYMLAPNVYKNEYNSTNENKATANEASTNIEIFSIESAPPNFFYEKKGMFLDEF